MNVRENIAVRLSMTRTEITVISLLMLFLIIGIIIRSTGSLQYADLVQETEPFTEAQVDSLLKEATLLDTDLARAGLDALHLQRPTTTAQKAKPGSRRIVFSTATAEDLGSIPGISNILAGRLISFRNTRNGKVERFTDFLEVKGIGRKRMETLEQHLILE